MYKPHKRQQVHHSTSKLNLCKTLLDNNPTNGVRVAEMKDKEHYYPYLH